MICMIAGADPDSIRTAYKRLASKWLPEKFDNTPEISKVNTVSYDSRKSSTRTLSSVYLQTCHVFVF